MFRFEKLEVWQVAVEFADLVYDATKSFPTDERYGLISQLRRASVSVSSNIAEGSGRGTDPDFRRFVEIAYGSLMECVSQLTIAKRREFVSADDQGRLYEMAERIAQMLSRLRSKLT